ncbi:MAG TPA: M28 family metallopeptidase [Steroidobacteraceae bacterium]|jgi:Zn-dependent M28 family amino/carboxypeptidase
MRKRSMWLAIGCVAIVALASQAKDATPIPWLDIDVFRAHVAALASDGFDGRKPGTIAEEKTVDYIRRGFAEAGLKPGHGTTFYQSVPLVEITAAPDATLAFERGATRQDLKYAHDMVVWTKRVVAQSSLDKSPLVFVGYGIVAPEYDWNDYAAADIKGKTAVILINDPGFATNDPKLFRGREMTYHGRWTYKFEEAARQGAAGALIIHETEPAAYGWNVVTASWTGPQLDLATADGNVGRVAIEGWISNEAAQSLFKLAGQDLAALQAAAAKRDFKAVPLGVQASVTVRNAIRRSNSSNVIGILPGSKRPDEYLIYTAHWDHFGHAVDKPGDAIFNGAIDNATGVAGIMTLARAFAHATTPPERSIVFLAVTGEESGLLGSAYYAENPIYPLAHTAAVVNLDALYAGGPARDIVVVGSGNSELEDYLRKAAKQQDRVTSPEPTPEKGFYYRSDHFNFAKKGVPALYTKLGMDDREHGREYGRQQQEEYIAKRYHQPSDEYSKDLDLRGSFEDLELMYRVGERVANEKSWPEWYKDSEFRAVREQSDRER